MSTATTRRLVYQKELLLILLKLQILLVSLGLLSNIARLIWEPPLRGLIQVVVHVIIILGSWGAIRLLRDGNVSLAANAYMGLVTVLAGLNIVTSPIGLLLVGVMLIGLTGIIAGFLEPLINAWRWGIFNTLAYIGLVTFRNQISDFALDLERSHQIGLYIVPILMIVIYTYLGQRIGQLIGENFVNQNQIARKNAELYNTALQEIAERIVIESELKKREAASQEFQEHLKTLHHMTLELSALDTIDDVYRRGIEYGLTKFGFDRVGLFRIDEANKMLLGTFGTDPDGNLRDERGYRTPIGEDPSEFWNDVIQTKGQVFLWEDAELLDHAQVIGRGWHARAVLWDGATMGGLLVADNLVHHRPPREYEVELISLYSATMSHAINRKQAELSLRQNEQVSREFQHHLEKLHQLTLELASFETLDEIYKRGVLYGLNELNLDRLAILRLDETKENVIGTYGTDTEGNLRAEHDFVAGIREGSPPHFDEVLARDDLVMIVKDIDLLDSKQIVGKGWHARAVLLDGKKPIGILVADNLIHHQPIRPYEQELISTFASAMAHAITRKQFEISLQQREQSSREFQEHLKKLHQLTIELTSLATLDEIYKRGVEYGLNELDLDRMAVLRLDESKQNVIGTYGTDASGQLRDERYFTAAIRDDSPPYYDDVLAQDDFVMIVEETDLRDNKIPVGRGWHACAVFMDGNEPIGMVVADNLIHQRPPRPYERELLSTFAATLSYAIVRKQSELSLRQREEFSRELKEHLKALHRITVELLELDDLDSIYKRSVEYGLQAFGFDRIGLGRIGDDGRTMYGKYGTDPDGKLRDEHDYLNDIYESPQPFWDELVNARDQVIIWDNVDLRDYGVVAGKGWKAKALLWDGTTVIGILAVDNLVRQLPQRTYEHELLAMFATTLAHIISRKEVELSLRQREQSSSELKEYLKTLHRMTLELSAFDELDAIYRRGIEFGLSEFGFDRVGLARLDESGQTMLGTYGTDPDGKLRDEHDFQSHIDRRSRLPWDKVIKAQDQVAIWQNDSLLDYDQVVGQGWNAMAALWDGTSILGVLSIDNLIRQQQPRPYELELISLYSGTLAHLIRTQEAKNTLRKNEQSAREFQDHLKTLHRMTIELGQLETIDEIFKGGVEYGLHEFGIDRLGLFLIDQEHEELVGMFGTDTEGNMRDERGFRTSIYGRAKQFLDEVVKDKDQVAIWEDAELIDYDKVIGTGWNGMAALWSGNQIIGAVAFDNLIHHRPLRPYESDLMRLYSSVLSHLVTRKRAEESRVDYAMEHERVKVLQQFLAAASHDLRTPLSVVQMNAYLLRSVDDEQQREHYLDIVDNQVERLKKLLEDMLAMSRLDTSSAFDYEWIDLVGLTHTIIDQQGALAAHKNHTIEFESSSSAPPIYADRVQLGQAIRNILMNALHYTPSAGTIQVRVYQESENAVIAIQDSGVGISTEQLPRIFERFYRSDSARGTETGGSGLGLSIAQKIIEGHHGRIEVESEIGVGSTFKIVLPLATVMQNS